MKKEISNEHLDYEGVAGEKQILPSLWGYLHHSLIFNEILRILAIEGFYLYTGMSDGLEHICIFLPLS